jgi:hypothetical protein
MKSKLKFILPIGGVLIAVVVVLLVFLLREEAYRVIQVSKVEGHAGVQRIDVGSLDAYAGMMLQSEDEVSVDAESYLYMKLDEDKYVMAEPGCKMHLKASGSSANSKTSIHLEDGAVVNRLDNKLSEESLYEVSTPNSVMAVRGTVFRVEVVIAEDGTLETHVSVYEGEVACSLIQPDGTVEDEIILVANDETIIIRSEKDDTFLVYDEPEEVEYEELERKILEFILKSIEENEDHEVTEETEELIRYLLSDRTVDTYTVTFRHNGNVFATQKVTGGECAAVPILLPSMTGGWDFDFTKPIEQDTIIDWKE